MNMCANSKDYWKSRCENAEDQLTRLKQENERLTARVAELEKIVEMCRQAYYAPPRDLPPSTPDDAKRVCSDLRAALSFYRSPASKRGEQ